MPLACSGLYSENLRSISLLILPNPNFHLILTLIPQVIPDNPYISSYPTAILILTANSNYDTQMHILRSIILKVCCRNCRLGVRFRKGGRGLRGGGGFINKYECTMETRNGYITFTLNAVHDIHLHTLF